MMQIINRNDVWTQIRKRTRKTHGSELDFSISIANALQILQSCTKPSTWDISFSERRSSIPDSKVHGANMGPTWVLSAPDGLHIGPMNLAMRDIMVFCSWVVVCYHIVSEQCNTLPPVVFCFIWILPMRFCGEVDVTIGMYTTHFIHTKKLFMIVGQKLSWALLNEIYVR